MSSIKCPTCKARVPLNADGKVVEHYEVLKSGKQMRRQRCRTVGLKGEDIARVEK